MLEPQAPYARRSTARRGIAEAEQCPGIGVRPAGGGKLEARPLARRRVPHLEQGPVAARIIGPRGGGGDDAVARDEDEALARPGPDGEPLTGERLVESVRIAGRPADDRDDERRDHEPGRCAGTTHALPAP